MAEEAAPSAAPEGAAVRDALFDLLYGALAAGGRREALLGADIASARLAYANMAPPVRRAHVLFEMPLVGRPGLDVIFGQTHPGGADTLTGADPAWRQAIDWLGTVSPAGDDRSDVIVMAEADASAGQSGQSGIYLIHWRRPELVGPFLEAIGEGGQRAAWEAFEARLPDDWTSTYVGVFPGRAAGLLRVNARPRRERSVAACAALLEGLEVEGASEALEPYADALARAGGFDCQLDVDMTGAHRGSWGLELFAVHDDSALGRHRMDPLLMAQMERLGAIDERWHLLEGLGLARSVAVPLAGETVSCALCLRFYSAKLKFPDGGSPSGKAYVKADAVVRGEPPAQPH